MIIYYTNRYSGKKQDSHRLLGLALADHTGDAAAAEELIAAMREEGCYGKPVIDGFDCFSISHSGSTWAVLIADRECGLDIQYHRDRKTGSIIRRYFAAEDREKAASGPDGFFRIWVRREALIKAAGMSVVLTDVPPAGGDHAEYCGRCWRIRDIAIPGADGSSAAFCIESGGPADEEPVFREIGQHK